MEKMVNLIMTITTPRLILRELTQADAESFYLLNADLIVVMLKIEEDLDREMESDPRDEREAVSGWGRDGKI